MIAKVRLAHYTDLEQVIQEALVKVSETRKAMWGRFYDTKSAGNTLPNQPSDFWLVYRGRAVFIEVKFSEVADSLANVFSKAVSDNQIASSRLAYRAGGSYWVVFYSAQSKQYEVWPGQHLAACRSFGKRLELSARTLCTTALFAIDAILSEVEVPSGR